MVGEGLAPPVLPEFRALRENSRACRLAVGAGAHDSPHVYPKTGRRRRRPLPKSRRNRLGFCAPKARRARFDEGVAPQAQKTHPEGCVCVELR